jgi:general secretion pathway protein N
MRRGGIALFIGLLALALIIFMPLSLTLSMFGLTTQGLTARAASGSIWSGKLTDAHIGRLAVGDLRIGLQFFPLFAGRARVDMISPLGRGGLTSMASGFSAADMTAKLGTARLFAPIPLETLDLTDVSMTFVAGKCTRAQGRVRAMFSGDVGGLALAQGLSGVVRCDGNAVLLPLVSQSAMERLNVRIQGNGDYRAEFFVRSTDQALAEKLGAAGFGPAPGGFELRLAGKL